MEYYIAGCLPELIRYFAMTLRLMRGGLVLSADAFRQHKQQYGTGYVNKLILITVHDELLEYLSSLHLGSIIHIENH